MVLYMCVMGINFVSFYDFSIGCWNCSDSVVFLLDVGTVPTVLYLYWMLELFRQCCISIGCWNCSDSVVFVLDVGTVPTVLYLYVFILLVHVKS